MSENADDVNIVIHNYRWRLGIAGGEPRYDDLERRLAEGPVIRTISGGVGHNHPQEAPDAFAQAVMDVAGY